MGWKLGFLPFSQGCFYTFLDIAQDSSLGQCLTSSRAETSKKIVAQIGVEMIYFILMLSVHANFFFKYCKCYCTFNTVLFVKHTNKDNNQQFNVKAIKKKIPIHVKLRVTLCRCTNLIMQ